MWSFYLSTVQRIHFTLSLHKTALKQIFWIRGAWSLNVIKLLNYHTSCNSTHKKFNPKLSAICYKNKFWNALRENFVKYTTYWCRLGLKQTQAFEGCQKNRKSFRNSTIHPKLSKIRNHERKMSKLTQKMEILENEWKCTYKFSTLYRSIDTPDIHGSLSLVNWIKQFL